jgi:hypothetical protein
MYYHNDIRTNMNHFCHLSDAQTNARLATGEYVVKRPTPYQQIWQTRGV